MPNDIFALIAWNAYYVCHTLFVNKCHTLFVSEDVSQSDRSRRPKVFFRKGVAKNFGKFFNTCTRVSFVIKFQAKSCFPVNLQNF